MEGLLHDTRNSIHYNLYEKLGLLHIKSMIERVHERFIDDYFTRIREEVLYNIYYTAYDIEYLTIEAVCVRVGQARYGGWKS